MITLDQMVAAAQDKDICALDFSAFDDTDIVNLVAQRSEIIFDEPDPGGIIKQWSVGNEGPVRDVVQSRRQELLRRAAGIIRAEYDEIKPVLDTLAPRSIADIGCGYAIYDLFHWRDFPGRVVLIDIETTDVRHFGYKETGAAYTNLDKAKAFLVANGVAARQISLVNPDKAPLPKTKVDLAVSFISCGFHYPVETYGAYFRDGVSAKGAIILDVRRRRVKEAWPALEAIGAVREVTASANGGAARLMVRKGVAAVSA